MHFTAISYCFLLSIFLNGINLVKAETEPSEKGAILIPKTDTISPDPAPNTPPATSAPLISQKSGFQFDHFEQGNIYFKQPGNESTQIVKTDIADLSYQGVLYSHKDGIPPYFLFTGKPCQNCLEDKQVFLIPPTGKPVGFVYPGRIIDPKNHVLVHESKGFYGRCLANRKGDVYVVFQKEKIVTGRRKKRTRIRSSVLIAEPGEFHLNQYLLERGLPRLDRTVKLAKKKNSGCHELDGRYRNMANITFDLHPNVNNDDDDDDDDKNPQQAPSLHEGAKEVTKDATPKTDS